jgi:hypothetical protein
VDLDGDVAFVGAVTMARLVTSLPDYATLKIFRLQLLPSNPLPLCRLYPIFKACNTSFLNRGCKNHLQLNVLFHTTQAMAGLTHNNGVDFNTEILSAIESNDLATLRNVLSKREAEGPDALRRGPSLLEPLEKAIELARYDMEEELFKHGARWGDSTIGAVWEGASEENEWNTKAIDVALAYGWNINEPYEHVGPALV